MQSELPKQHTVTISVENFPSNSDLYEHIWQGKIIKLYKSAGKCENQQQYKTILGAYIVYIP